MESDEGLEGAEIVDEEEDYAFVLVGHGCAITHPGVGEGPGHEV